MCLQGVENAVGVLRNLSYQLYSEIPSSTLLRLEGPTRARATTETESIGCFTPQSKKAKEVGVIYTRQPKGNIKLRLDIKTLKHVQYVVIHS